MTKNGLKSVLFPNLTLIRKVGHLACPDCNETMSPFSCQNVVLDKFGLCEGLWFDHREFGVFKRGLDSLDLSVIHKINKP